MFCSSLFAAVYYVDDVPNNGSGTQASPFNNLSSALNAAQPGDMVYVLPGTYHESFSTGRDGTANQRITIQAHDPGNRPLVTFSGRVLAVDHSYITIDGFILDGQFGSADVVKIKDGGDNLVVRNCEIKNGLKDGIDLNEADNVLIENCEIHHMLGGSLSNQVDAHGIVATGENNLTIRGCNIYYTSGDCFQTDPNRGYPLWESTGRR
jgi:pectate lyase